MSNSKLEICNVQPLFSPSQALRLSVKTTIDWWSGIFLKNLHGLGLTVSPVVKISTSYDKFGTFLWHLIFF